MLLGYLPACIGNARCCTSAFRLCNYVIVKNLRDLLLYQVCVALTCHYPEVFLRADSFEAIHSKLDEGLPYSKHIHELLRQLWGAHRPESATDSACHYHYMCLHHQSLLNMSLV